MNDGIRHPASFRDPSGFVFQKEGIYYRRVNKSYKEDYNHLIGSGLYDKLVGKELIVPFKEVSDNQSESEDWHLTLLPQQLEIISYPYEWCFDQFKDAALLTLSIMRVCIENGMILKDATPFNIQFCGGRPVWCDSLSFNIYDESKPWIAYKQFCESFVFPLSLVHYLRMNFQKLLTLKPEGISAEATSRLMPWRSIFNLNLWLHIWAQKKYLHRYSRKNENRISFSKKKMSRLIDHLEIIINGLENKDRSLWCNYYTEGYAEKKYLSEKEQIVSGLLRPVDKEWLIDIGANTGNFSRIASQKGFNVIAIDSDCIAINDLYKMSKGDKSIFPLCVDVMNPSPAIGFLNKERMTWWDRMPRGYVLALAVLHHLVIGQNIRLDMLAEFFSSLGPVLIIEFVPKTDEMVMLMLKTKKDIYAEYTEDNFRKTFDQYYTIDCKEKIPGSERTIYYMKRRNNDE